LFWQRLFCWGELPGTYFCWDGWSRLLRMTPFEGL
jgi:hypothetical protein